MLDCAVLRSFDAKESIDEENSRAIEFDSEYREETDRAPVR
jgi:hypothetical protein